MQLQMEGLQHFANHTRHRASRDGDLTMLGRKWMAIHVAPASPQTYALVADDYPFLEARTHSPPLASYAERNHPVNVDTFVWIAKNGYPTNRPLTMEEEQQWPALAQFRDTLWPKPMDQEAWQPFERRDHWKERAYFLAAAGACKDRPQFHALIQAIYMDDVDETKVSSSSVKDGVSDLYTRILRSLPEPSTYELGTLISALDLHHLEQGGPSCEEARQQYLKEKQEQQDESVPVTADASSGDIILAPHLRLEPPVDESILRNDPSVVAFRERHLIPPTFSTHKVMQQMVLTHLGQPVPSHLLSSAQRRADNQPVGPVALSQTIFDWFAALPDEKLASHLDLKCPQLQSYYFGGEGRRENAGQPISAQTLILGVIQDERHRKLWPTVEPSVVKAIIEI